MAWKQKREGSVLLILIFSLSLAAGCGRAEPNLPRIFPPPSALKQTGKNPIIIIPGILGSELVNRRTGERVWPSLFEGDDDALDLPISSADLRANRDDLEASEILDRAKFAALLPEIGIYDSLLVALERYGGYKSGDFDNPPPDGDRDTFYVFAYDWRRDNTESAARLAEKISALKARLGRPDLRFDLVAHSMGGLVARYYAMYGGRDALADSSPDPDWAGAQNIGRLIMFGTPNAGTMDALRSLVAGYSLTETNRRRISILKSFSRATIFTMPSVYQLLPHRETARFLNADLSTIEVDLFDVETWRRYGWSIAFEERALKASEAERARFLRSALERAEAFHRALDVDEPLPPPLNWHIFGGDCEPTLDAVMLVLEEGRWRTVFHSREAPGGKQARERAFAAMFAPGDGRVTRQSVFGVRLIPGTQEPIVRTMRQETRQAFFACQLHGDLPIDETFLDNLLTVLMGNKY